VAKVGGQIAEIERRLAEQRLWSVKRYQGP
jgi:hypothetical protein